MSLPTSLKSLRMTNATTGDQIDDNMAALEQAICDLVGIPIDTAIAAAGFSWDAAGLKKIIYQDQAGDPTAVGQVARNGSAWKMHNGLYVCGVPQSINNDNNTVTVSNTTGEVQFLAVLLKGGILGTTRRLRLTAVGRVNTILNGGSDYLAFAFNWYGVRRVLVHNLYGGTTTTRSNIPWRWVLEIYMNGAANSFRVFSSIAIVGWNAPSVPDYPGFGTSNGLITDLRAADSIVSDDLSVDHTLQLTFGWTNANPNNNVSYNQSMVEILP